MALMYSNPYLIVNESDEIEEILDDAKRLLENYQEGTLVEYGVNPKDCDEEHLKAQVNFYKDRYDLSSKGIRNLRKRTKETGDPQFERKAEENKMKVQHMRQQYKDNQENQLPCCYISPDGFGSGSASAKKVLEFSFTVIQSKSGEKMIPTSQNNYYIQNFMLFHPYYWGKREFYGIANSNSRYVKYSDPDYIEDNVIAEALSEWAKHYDETIDGISGTYERAEIYADIKNYVFAYKELKELEKSASTAEHLSIIQREKEILDEKRNILLLKITNSTEVMKFLNSEKKNALELESVENADLEFQRKVEKYRSIY